MIPENGPYGSTRIFRALPKMSRSVLMGRIKAKRDVLARLAKMAQGDPRDKTMTRRPKLEVAGTRAPDDALSAEQQQVLDAVSEGRNIFITGSAGVGKSFILKKVMQQVKDRGDGKGLCVAGCTGAAARLIGGQTLHAFAGVGRASIYSSPEIFANSITKVKKNKERWMRCKVLIIDEVSMLDAQLFEQLDFTAREIKGSMRPADRARPWGGIQLILCGDFFQLPPIINKDDRPRVAKAHLPIPYAFKAHSWKESIDLTIELTVVFRQSDRAFVDLLNRVRRGQQTPEDLQVLRNCRGKASGPSDERPTVLFSVNKPVDEKNESELKRLGGEAHIFKADDEGSAEGKKMLEQFTLIPKKLTLKVGAQVMMTKNVSVKDGLVNGARVRPQARETVCDSRAFPRDFL